MTLSVSLILCLVSNMYLSGGCWDKIWSVTQFDGIETLMLYKRWSMPRKIDTQVRGLIAHNHAVSANRILCVHPQNPLCTYSVTIVCTSAATFRHQTAKWRNIQKEPRLSLTWFLMPIIWGKTPWDCLRKSGRRGRKMIWISRLVKNTVYYKLIWWFTPLVSTSHHLSQSWLRSMSRCATLGE